ncbi:MAG: extracellular solute-binding protein [Deltaproteobacteria bacterium]|nr:extracellular solute-binding protein [Deltaproteobacteria bacterium]
MPTIIIKSLTIAACFIFILTPSVFAEETVHVYSSRIDQLIKPVFDAFTVKTGIKVKYTTAKEAELIERLKAEGKFTQADVLITVDAGNLWLAQNEGLLQPVSSKLLDHNVPFSLKEKQNHWFGLSIRARTIVYHNKRVKPSELSSYEALGEAKWKGRLCLRTSKKVYNKSLVAMMIESLGEPKTEKVIRSWIDNQPEIYSNDTSLLKAIVAGKCDVGIVNTYYLGRILKEDPDFPVSLFWANQDSSGVHVNISGAGVIKFAKRKENALKLIEFLSGTEAQNLFSDDNLEYPANPNIPPSPLLVKWWGKNFKKDSTNLSAAGKNQKRAVMLMNRVGYK